MTVCLYLPAEVDGGKRSVGFMFKRPAIDNNDAFDAAGMKWTMVKPFEELKVDYVGKVVLLDEPEQMADPKAAFTNNPFDEAEVHLTFTGQGRPSMFGGEPDEPHETPGEEFAKGHYEQLIAATGTIKVGDAGVGHQRVRPARPLVGPPLLAGAVVLPLAHRQRRRELRVHGESGGEEGRPGHARRVRVGERHDAPVRRRRDHDRDPRRRPLPRPASRACCGRAGPIASGSSAARSLSLIPLRNRRQAPDGEWLQTRISEAYTEWTVQLRRVRGTRRLRHVGVPRSDHRRSTGRPRRVRCPVRSGRMSELPSAAAARTRRRPAPPPARTATRAPGRSTPRSPTGSSTIAARSVRWPCRPKGPAWRSSSPPAMSTTTRHGPACGSTTPRSRRANTTPTRPGRPTGGSSPSPRGAARRRATRRCTSCRSPPRARCAPSARCPTASAIVTWSPDGRWIAFTSRTRDERYEEKDESWQAPRKVERFLSRLNGEDWIFDRPQHVYVVAADGTVGPAQPDARRVRVRRHELARRLVRRRHVRPRTRHVGHRHADRPVRRRARRRRSRAARHDGP